MRRITPSLKLPTCIFSINRSLHGQTNPGPMASILKTRSVVRFSGPETIKFLQGLLTNDIRRFGDPASRRGKTSTLLTSNMPYESSSPMYAALLTPQGRFLYDLFLYAPPRAQEKLDTTESGPRSSSDDGSFELFADLDVSVLDEVLQTFKKYRLRSKVEIENVSEDFSCWQRYGGNLSEKSSSEKLEAASVGGGGGTDRTGMSASRGSVVGWQWFKDPTLDCLGFRGIFQSNTVPPLVEADKETSEENYLLWRLEIGVAEGSSEIPKGEAMPLEYNLAGLNAISFDKGCYVGQELIARTHHRGVIRKRLLPLRFLNDKGEEMDQKVAPGSEVIDAQSGKKAGKVTTTLGCLGMGILGLEEAFEGSGTLKIQGLDDVRIETIKVACRVDYWASNA